MTINKEGLYEVTEGEMVIRDPKTGEEMIFVLDPKTKLVVRSMTEEDIKTAINIMPISRSEKRKKMKTLWEELPKRGSEKYLFVAEKIIREEVENLYEADREIIGFGARVEKSLDINIFKKEHESRNLLKIVTKLADYFGIKGEPYLLNN